MNPASEPQSGVESYRTRRSGTLAHLLPYLVAILLIFPSLIWIARDTSAWGGDQSQYGIATLELFRTLVHAPQEWPRRMLDVFTYKPNGLIWLGQAFVPLAYVIPSIDTSLLLAVILLQVAALVLVYKSLRELSSSRFVAPATAGLVIASAPLFISFAHQYLVESYQVTSVAWFLLIMVMAPKWSRWLLAVQLVAATAFAMSAKEIQPLFCVWPGLVVSFYLLWPRVRPDAGADRIHTRASLALAIPLTTMTVAWYVRNQATVTQHLRDGTYGPGVKTLWGKEDTYVNTLVYWAQTGRTVFFLPGVAELVLLLVAAAVAFYLMRPKRLPAHFTLCAVVAALQIVTVVMVFSLSPTRQDRYLLPALPYVAVLVAWSVAQINSRALTALTIGVFATQFVLLQGQALNALPVVGRWVGPLNWNARSGRIMASILARTCARSDAGPLWNVLAVEPSIPELAGDWLAPEPANYQVSKLRWRQGGEAPCQYGYLGDGFFGSDVAHAWDSLLSRQAQYVVVVDPARYPTPERVFNQALSRENYPVVLERLESSDWFTAEARLPEDPGILIYQRVDRITKGRALSDRGLHDQALVILRRAAVLEPTNAEAWANLAFACERAGSLEEAVSAGMRAKQLNPRHYYADMILARVLFQQNKWKDVVRQAAEAEAHAPAARERADALTLGASGAFRLGDVSAGCAFMRRGSLTPTAEILGRFPGDVCAKQ